MVAPSAPDRIKTFPFPRQYAFFSGVFVNIFLALLPFALLGELAGRGGGQLWLVAPFGMLISWVFTTMEQVGDSSENPFEGGLNDIPMTAICRRIEIDLRAFLGESDLPPPLGPVDGILM